MCETPFSLGGKVDDVTIIRILLVEVQSLDRRIHPSNNLVEHC